MEKSPAGATMETSPAGPAMDKPGTSKKNTRSKKMPSARDLVSHYENQGMETQEASLKVIQDLQGALFRIVATNRNPNSPKVTSDKLDVIHARLLSIERKMDSKPSYPQALTLGVASAGIWNAALQIWNSVRQPTSSSQ